MSGNFLDPRKLIDELRKLSRAYVSLLETGRDRIIMHGGSCDSVEEMERGDPALNRVKVAIEAAEIELRNAPSKEAARSSNLKSYTWSGSGMIPAVEGDKRSWYPAEDVEALLATIRTDETTGLSPVLQFTYATCESGGGAYQVTLGFEMLNDAQEAHKRLVTLQKSTVETSESRRPTGQCSWGCYYSGDGRLVRDSACTVHGASSEKASGDQHE